MKWRQHCDDGDNGINIQIANINPLPANPALNLTVA